MSSLEELKIAALALGYRLSKIPAKKAKVSTDEDAEDADVALVVEEKKEKKEKKAKTGVCNRNGEIVRQVTCDPEEEGFITCKPSHIKALVEMHLLE